MALAEAGLIRFFQPQYNDRMKYSFPARKQITLESVRRLDFHGLLVELQSQRVDGLYGSNVQKYSWIHFAGFFIRQGRDRGESIVMAATDALPGMPPRA